MRGIDLQIPKFGKELLTPGDFVFWEARHEDGHVVREAMGGLYRQIDRSQLKSFLLVTSGGEALFEAFVPPGATGHNLCYRRTEETGGDGRYVVFKVGWAPYGPVVITDAIRADVAEKWHQRCERCRTVTAYSDWPTLPDRTHPEGIFSPPVPMPLEGEHFALQDGLLTLTR